MEANKVQTGEQHHGGQPEGDIIHLELILHLQLRREVGTCWQCSVTLQPERLPSHRSNVPFSTTSTWNILLKTGDCEACGSILYLCTKMDTIDSFVGISNAQELHRSAFNLDGQLDLVTLN